MTTPIDRQTPNRREIMALVRLLRFVAKGPGRLESDGAGCAIVISPTGAQRDVAQAILQKALSSGLLTLGADGLAPTPQATSFLRRALSKDRDEIFQAQHREDETVTVEIGGVRQSARQNALSSPLQALARLKDRQGERYFSAQALAAGDRFARDFHHGHLNPRVTASFTPRLSQRAKGQFRGAQDLNDSALAARLRFSAAAHALGPELSGVAIDICCFEKGLELVERERQWPARSAKLLLRAALQALDRHYAPPAPTTARRNSHHWGTQDYRPDL